MAQHLAPGRDDSYDALKGVLVLLMVVYHVMSIASNAGPEAYRYIRFISGSFIFISGFVVVHFMWERYLGAPLETGRRLVTRGLKVLMLFSLLNLAIHASGFGNADKEQLGVVGFLRNAATIFLSGDGRQSSFVILLPIAYLLILSPIFMAATRRFQLMAPLVTLLAVLGLASGWLALPPVAEFILVGLFGLSLGSHALAERLLRPIHSSMFVTVMGLAWALWLAGQYGSPLAMYCLGVALVLRFMLDMLRLLPTRQAGLRLTVRLGQYSLFAYIAQIAIIQLIFRALGSVRDDKGYLTAALIVLVALVCVALCALLDRMRQHSKVVDRAYRWVFA